MATLGDIGVSAAINIFSAFIFFVLFAILRLQPFNDRVYFPKWYLKGLRTDPTSSGAVSKFVNLDYRSYLRFLNWMPDALRMPEPELIDHAGLDSAIYLRIYLTGVKIFVPIAFLVWAILVPVNFTNSTLELASKIANVTSSDIDKFSISNVPLRSQSILTGLLSFMMDNSPTTGNVNTTVAEKQSLAKASLAFNCKNPTFRKMFSGYVDKYNQQQLSKKLAAEGATRTISGNFHAHETSGRRWEKSRCCKGYENRQEEVTPNLVDVLAGFHLWHCNGPASASTLIYS